MRQFDFEGVIEVVDWVDQEVVRRLAVTTGFRVMGRSERFETHNTTAEVRVLSDEDAELIGVPKNRAVVFRQVRELKRGQSYVVDAPAFADALGVSAFAVRRCS